MVIECINLGLEVGVLIEKGRIIISRVFKLFSELHNLIFSHADLSIIILNKSGELSISDAFLVNPSLDIGILIAVSLIERSQMLKLFLVAGLLSSQLEELALGINQGSLFILKSECLIIKDTVEVINACKRLGDIVFNGSNLGSELNALLAL